MNSKWRRDKTFLVIISLATLFALAYNFAILLGLGPDEQRHINYVKLLLEQRQLPEIITTQPYKETAGAHAFHPPLYYLVLLPFYALFRGLPGESGWHLLRLISLVLCLIPLPLIYQIARQVGSQNFARLVVAQIALLPMWGMTASTINNDSATFCAVTIFLWLLLVKFKDNLNFRACLWLGLAMGLGGLCKATALLCDGAALLLFLRVRDGKGILKNKAVWQSALTILLIGVVIVSPWHIRSMLLYGTWTPLPQAAPTPFLPAPEAGKLVQMMHPNFPMLFALANWRMFYTLWGQRDWLMQRTPNGPVEPVQGALYLFFAAYTLIAFIGIVLRWQRERPQPGEARLILYPCYGAFVLTWLTVLQVALFMHWGWSEGGRYLLPAFVGFSLLSARGFQGLTDEKGLISLTNFWVIFGFVLNGLSLWWLLSYLNPTFGPK
jgi:4-amino-4-deoxy-L-arabinose transferase-like glycosyltransferase